MENRRWLPWDRLMRGLHLYTSMFLVPWMVVYAVSAFCINHSGWFVEKGQPAQKWESVRETAFTPDAGFPTDPEEQVAALLAAVDMEGPYRIMGVPDAIQLTILRISVPGHYRVTWQRTRNHVVIDRLKPASLYSSVNNLHFLIGYGQSSWLVWIWAVIVDAVTISTVIWVISGIYLWARRRRKRLLGGLCLGAGCLLFLVLVILLCR
jgi:hypothetical protein